MILVGYSGRDLSESFLDCKEVARIDNGVDVDNDEQGAPVSVCAGPQDSWSSEWPELRHLG